MVVGGRGGGGELGRHEGWGWAEVRVMVVVRVAGDEAAVGGGGERVCVGLGMVGNNQMR